MIARHWTGLAKKDRAADYMDHLRMDTFKQLARIKGFVQASILKRELEEGTEFLVITQWETVDAIKAFAGPQYDTAVVPPFVQQLMIRYDTGVKHYEIITP